MNMFNLLTCPEGLGSIVSFIKNIFGDFPFAKNPESKNSKNSQEKPRRNSRRKYVEMYCSNLTRKARENKNLTQEELGNLIFYSDKTISAWEKGIYTPSNYETIIKLSEVLEIAPLSIAQGGYGNILLFDNNVQIKYDNMTGVSIQG